jgi:hypothetical protein
LIKSSKGENLIKVWNCTFDLNNYCGGVINKTNGLIDLRDLQQIAYASYYITDVTSISKALKN